jgi:hypothetical protein
MEKGTGSLYFSPLFYVGFGIKKDPKYKIVGSGSGINIPDPHHRF